jgi:hypothetical protein
MPTHDVGRGDRREQQVPDCHRRRRPERDDESEIDRVPHDVATGSHIWAERYDRDLADVFAVQDEITEAIVAAIERSSMRRRASAPSENRPKA